MPPHLSPLSSSTGYKNTPEKTNKLSGKTWRREIGKKDINTFSFQIEFEKQTSEETGEVQKNIKILWKPANIPEHKKAYQSIKTESQKTYQKG